MFDIDLLVEVPQLHASAARIAAAIDADVSGPVADEALAEALAAGRQLELATCRLIGRAEKSGQFAVDGAGSTVAYVRGKVNERPTWAAKRVAAGRALDRLPFAAKSWEAGRLGLDHLDVIDQATRRLDDELVAELDRILSEAAADGLDPADLTRLADTVRADTVPDEAAAKAERQYRDQKLHASKTLGGMVNITGWLDPEAGELFNRALAFFTPPPPTAAQLLADPSCGEPIAFRRAQALTQLARHALAHAQGCNGEGGTRETMIVGVGLDVLTQGRGVGTVAGGGLLGAGAFRRMACDTHVIPAVLGSRSELLDLGRRTRTVSPGLRAAVILRDGRCIFTGCDRPPSWCEAHHRQHWVNYGPTSENNLDLLCSHHHHLVHEGGWRLTVDNDTTHTPRFHPPNGRPPLQGQRRPLIRSNRRT